MIIYWGGGLSFGEDDILRFDPIVLNQAIEEFIGLISLSSISVNENGDLVSEFSLPCTSILSANAGRDITETISLIASSMFSLTETMDMLAEFGIIVTSNLSFQTQQDILEILNFVFSPYFTIEGVIALKEAKGIGITLQFMKVEYSAEFRNQDLSFDFKVSNR
jgi:hypothetical protein